MTQDDLAQMSREELVELVLAQFGQIAKLQAEFEALKMKVEKGKKPPTNSSNSSQSPSRDQKSNLSEKRTKHRHAPPVGHAKHERKFVAKPDHIVEVKPVVCKQCQADLSEMTTILENVNQVTELPEAKAEVIEVRQYAAACPSCGQEQIGEPPAGLEMNLAFGAHLEATVVYYRQEQHMSYVRTKSAFRDLHGVEISEGGIDKIMQRAGRHARQQMEPIQNKIQQSKVINSDETGSRVDGQNWWQWVFCSATAVLHVIRSNRSMDVIKDVMADHIAEVWGCDCLLGSDESSVERAPIASGTSTTQSAGCSPRLSSFFLAEGHASHVPICDSLIQPERSSVTTRVPSPNPTDRALLRPVAQAQVGTTRSQTTLETVLQMPGLSVCLFAPYGCLSNQ